MAGGHDEPDRCTPPMTQPPHLAIFAKPPRLGRVKRRLAAGIGWIEATRFYRIGLAALLRRLGRDRRWRTGVWLDALGPTSQPARLRISGAKIAIHDQGRGDLGARMAKAFRDLPPGPVVLIGSDIPDVEPHHIEKAFRALKRCDAVLGPATDGGYWLIGLKGRARRTGAFQGIRWSSGFTFADQMRKLENFRVGLLDVLADVDTPDDYKRWRRGRAKACGRLNRRRL